MHDTTKDKLKKCNEFVLEVLIRMKFVTSRGEVQIL